ncbi:MAG TPA: electron transport complex subunit RsxE [Bacilli bacterium]|nr:electron transport complex subunit RsxE [Bacilli bacterium]
MKQKINIFISSAFSNNSTFVLLLGLCSILATSSTLSSAVGMGLAVMIVLMMTNLIISLLRKIIPPEIRIPVYIIIIASTVTIVEMLMKAFTPQLTITLGVYLQLIVVNCIIMARAEVFASKNKPLDSLIDGVGTGFGYLISIIVLSLLREILGTGSLTFVNPFTNATVFSWTIFDARYAISLMVSNTGAFLILGLLLAAINGLGMVISSRKKRRKEALIAKGEQG